MNSRFQAKQTIALQRFNPEWQKTPKYSLLVIPKCAPQVQSGGRPPYWTRSSADAEGPRDMLFSRSYKTDLQAYSRYLCQSI